MLKECSFCTYYLDILSEVLYTWKEDGQQRHRSGTLL
jgi:hypothetical protein